MEGDGGTEGGDDKAEELKEMKKGGGHQMEKGVEAAVQELLCALCHQQVRSLVCVLWCVSVCKTVC